MDNKRFRLRRSMMFLSAQRPSLMKDAYIYGSDSVMFDLEDAVSENQKDAARFSLYHALQSVDYGNVERLVRMNALDTPHWQEDIRVSVAGGADGIRIAKCETAEDVRTVEKAVGAAEKEFGIAEGHTLLMAALESPRGVLNALEIAESSSRMFGIALSGGDFRRTMQTTYTPTGNDLFLARSTIVIAARAAGIQCFDTVFTDLDDTENFRKEVDLDKELGFDGKSLISPKQIAYVHKVYTPTPKEIIGAERIVQTIEENMEKGIGVFTLDGQMLDIAFLPGAQRVIEQAKAAGVYEGDL